MENYKFSFNPITGNLDLVNKESTINYDRIFDTYSNTGYDTLNVEQVENDVTITLSREILDQAFFSLFLNGLRLLDNIDFMYDNQVQNKVHILNYQLNSNTDTIICKYRSGLFQPNYIIFEDPLVKSICVSNWGNGQEITYEEADSVADIGGVFANSNITDFKELQYLTRLVSIGKEDVIGGWAGFYGCASLQSIILPPNLQTIGYNAFCNCGSLLDINIPNNVTRIIANAFTNCNQLNNITLSENIISIGNGAFDNTISLSSIALPLSLRDIGLEAFQLCGITDIIIPQNVESIGTRAFAFTHLLNVRMMNAIPPTIGYEIFQGVETDFHIIIPQGSLIAYQTAPNWSIYADRFTEHIIL